MRTSRPSQKKEVCKMKRIKYLLAALLILSLTLSMASCFVISGEKMNRLKGTYKLTHYTYTPQHERRDGYTPPTYDYVNGEDYKYEDYLIIGGTGNGYYVHKDASGDCYVKEVTIAYEYDSEGKGKVEYIIHNDSISVNSDESGTHRLGVNKKILNYSKSAFDYTQLITKKPMRSESISVRWEKVDRATDLSYVQEQLGSLKSYDYISFSARGIYEVNTFINTVTSEHLESKYQYFFYVIDTVKNAESATVYYALKEAPTEQIKLDVPITRGADDWSSMVIDGLTWTREPTWGSYYFALSEHIEKRLSLVSHSITQGEIESLIKERLPE